jgi:MFS family permease
MTRPLSPLRQPNFRWFFLATSINMMGGTMASVALAFAVLEISDSPSALGQVLAANSIPLVVFLLLGGVIADRVDRARLIQVGMLLAGLSQAAAASLVIAGVAEIWHLIVLGAVNGVVFAASFPAQQAVLPELVDPDDLQAANVLRSMVRGALTIISTPTTSRQRTCCGPWCGARSPSSVPRSRHCSSSPWAQAGRWPSTPAPGSSRRQ